MNKDVCLVFVTMIALITNVAASAEIYKWVDEHGAAHFTDTPPADAAAETLDLKINTYTAVEITPLLERLGRRDKVVIYTATWCGICNQAKQYFKVNNIPYVAYDVEKSRTGRSDFRLLRSKSVPVILVGGKRMNGFTVARFDALYKQIQEEQKMVNELDGR